MIGRVLAAEIDQRLPGTNVFGESGAIEVTPDAAVTVNISPFDLDDSGAVVLTAQVGVTFATGRRPACRSVCVLPCQPTRPILAGRSLR